MYPRLVWTSENMSTKSETDNVIVFEVCHPVFLAFVFDCTSAEAMASLHSSRYHFSLAVSPSTP